MDITIINQLIETFGILFIPVITYFFANKFIKCRENVKREIALSKDILFFRLLLEKYKDKIREHEDKNYYNTFRSEVSEEMNYKQSRNSEKAIIEKRLKDLEELSEDISKNITKL
jgi:hypothetical protein